jgi:hydroxylamine reductase
MAEATTDPPPMFCYQCEQTAKGQGCTTMGVCGKDAKVSALQDLLVHAVQGLSMVAHRAGQLGERDAEVDDFVPAALFVTLTNVNFDPAAIAGWVRRAAALRQRARRLYEQAARQAGRAPEPLGGPAAFKPAADLKGLLAQVADLSIQKRIQARGADLPGLEELVLYGLKGACAYLDHARILGKRSPAVFADVHEVLDALARRDQSADDLVALALRVGTINLKAMELLDAANTGAYGHPEPTSVRIAPLKGKAVLVSGHDLKDLEELLKQTEGKGINVYTHGEMLPCLAYPGLKKHKHLAGNYGGAWQDQRKEFDEFPGAILMTTNCLIKPKDSYKDRIFTSGVVGWPGVRHITDRNFTPAIEAALAAPGFAADAPERRITIGFGREAVMAVAGKVIEAVKAGDIRRFFLIGGCDGARPGRNYYTDLAQALPKDCVILTLACGKYRFNKLEFGSIGGIPRLLDVGQCNDAYSAIQIALALAKAFNCGVNDLPLALVLSWFEQKAVAILLTLLALGVRNMRLGPSLPAFVTPPVLKVLAEKFNLMPISTPEADLKAILGA